METGRTAISEINPALGDSILVVSTHVRSKLYADDNDQLHVASILAEQIASAEQQVGHCRTLVFGDFNMDPYDRGMMNANGLHAVMDKEIAKDCFRTVNGKEYKYFYNPMWSRLGDESVGPCGTFYLNRSGHVENRFWSHFDQILLRPDLIGAFHKDDLAVVFRIRDHSLLRNGRIDDEISDHLPIVIKLNTERALRR